LQIRIGWVGHRAGSFSPFRSPALRQYCSNAATKWEQIENEAIVLFGKEAGLPVVSALDDVYRQPTAKLPPQYCLC
jgi:hypothetical protein